MALREIVAAFGISVDSKKVDEADKKVGDFIGSLGKLGQMISVGATAFGIKAFAEHLSEIGDHLDKTAIRMGIGTDALQQLQFAADQSGVGLDTFNNAIGRLQDLVGDAMTDAAGPGAKALKELGLSFKDASGEAKSADVLLAEVADIIKATDDPTQRVTKAMNAFGKAGRELLPMLAEGSEGIAELRKQQEELGGGFSKDAVKASAEYDDALGRLGTTIQSVKGRIAVVLLPALQRLVDGATKVVSKFLELSKNSSLVEGVLIAIAAALTTRMVPAVVSLLKTLAPLSKPLAIFVLMALAIDEIITLMDGGQTVIGEFLDKLYGKGTAANFPWDVRNLLKGITEAFENAIETIKTFYKALTGGPLSSKDATNINKSSQALRNPFGFKLPHQDVLERVGLVLPDDGEPAIDPGAFERQARQRAREAGRAAAFSVAGGGGGTSISQPTSIVIQAPPGSDENFIAGVVGGILGRRNDEVIAAMKTEVPK